MDGARIENIFFSLSSESRLAILNAVCFENLRMNEVARKINITATEASRQIQRLIDECILQKQPDGTYILTNYGRLLLHFFPSLEFISKHRSYFVVHDVWQLPPQFISRIGELFEGVLCTEIAETVNKLENMMRSAEEYVWVITDQVMTVHSNVMIDQISRGVKFKSLIHERLISSSQVRVFGENVERRLLSSIPVLLVVTDKEAFVSLLDLDKKIAHTGFFSSAPAFMQWTRDLFVYHWDQTKRQYPKFNPA